MNIQDLKISLNKRNTDRASIAGRLSGFFLSLLVCLSFFSSPAHAQAARVQQRKGPVVIAVRVKGNRAISTSIILSKIRTKEGEHLSQETVNDDIKRLYTLGYFTDVMIDVEDYKSGVMVTVIVEEKPVISAITFTGNKEMRTPKLKKALNMREGDMLNYGRLSEGIAEIKALFERNGFHDTTVKYDLEKDTRLNQVEVKILIRENPRMRIKKVTVKGNKAVKSKTILELMETRPAWFFRRGYFDEDAFENDLAKIKMLYQDRGFLDASVTPAFDLDKEKGIMVITLNINEGKKYTIGKIGIEGNLVLPKEKVLSRLTIKTGEAFSYMRLREDVEKIRSLYYQEGYMNAKIGVDRALRPQTSSMDVMITVNAQDIVEVGKVTIKGNTRTKDVVIRRELRVYPGERFDGDKLRRSKERLYNLGFFEDIYFETKPTSDPSVNDLEISVKETKTGEFSFGGGYSSVDEFIGFIQVTQKNFDLLNIPYFTGDGQALALRAEYGSVRANFDLSWTEPWIFDYPLSFGFDGYHKTHFRRTHVGYGYNETRSGGDVRLGKEFMEYFLANFMYRLEHVNISDVSQEASKDLKDETGKNWISSAILSLAFDNRDNVYVPTKGFYTGITLENTGGIIGGNKDYMKGFGWLNFYYSPIEKIVLELKGRAGLTDSYSDTKKVPIFERFYAGGADTIRGYEERRVGPRDTSSNDPLGGESMLIGNAEITFPLYENLLKGAVFYDIGGVWENVGDFASGPYKMGTGVGVRVKTPIGPIKVDWGYPLSDNHDDKKEGRFYFSVSHGF